MPDPTPHPNVEQLFREVNCRHDFGAPVICLKCVETVIAELLTRFAQAQETPWQPIETWVDENDGAVILRPHVIYGAMDVRYKPGFYDDKYMAWVNGDYTTAWPEEAFLPFWMPVPTNPPSPGEAGSPHS